MTSQYQRAMNRARLAHRQSLEALTPSELRDRANGCTEATCIYHGAYSRRLIELGEERS